MLSQGLISSKDCKTSLEEKGYAGVTPVNLLVTMDTFLEPRVFIIQIRKEEKNKMLTL